MAVAHAEILNVFRDHGLVCRMTSGAGGKHSVGSLHYVGHAADYGLRDIPEPAIRELLQRDIKTALGPDFDVVLEPTHIHVEFQPKTRMP